MAVEIITNFFDAHVGALAKFVLLPIYFALILYVVLYFTAKHRDVSLGMEFHKKSFYVSLIIIF